MSSFDVVVWGGVVVLLPVVGLLGWLVWVSVPSRPVGARVWVSGVDELCGWASPVAVVEAVPVEAVVEAVPVEAVPVGSDVVVLLGEVREVTGWSWARVAAELGVSVGAVAGWRRGSRPSAVNVERVRGLWVRVREG